MTPNPRTLDVTATVRDAVVLMSELDVRHVPILDDGDLAGIISDRDIKGALGVDAMDVDAYARQLDAPVSRLMSAFVITVGPEDELAEAIDIMLENRLGNVPVVAEDPPTLVGVLSYVDILRAARDAL